MPHSAESRWLRGALAAFAAAVAAWGGGARAQAPESGGYSAPAEARGLDGLRGEIDPDRPGDPFAADREAERDAAERRRAGEEEAEEEAGPLLEGEAEAEAQAEGRPARYEADPRRRPPEARKVPAAREREIGPYEPLGIRMGSFLVFPEIVTGVRFSDNPGLSATNPRSDHASVVEPSLALRSTWSRHSLEGSIRAERSYYSEFSALDDELLAADLRGRLDVARRTKIEAAATHLDTLEAVDAIDAPEGAAERTPLRTTGGTLEASHRFNRLTASLRGRIDENDYGDVRLQDGSIANNDDRDYTERRLTGRLGYVFRPGMAAFVESSVNKREFASRVDDSGIVRGSDGYTAMAGVSLELGGKITGEFAAGYARQRPDATRFGDIAGLIFDAALEWRPTALTTLRLDAGSEIDETTLTDSPGSLNRSATVSLEHAFRRNVIAGVSLGYAVEDFAGIDLVEEDYTLGLTGEYMLSRSVALVGSYEFTESTSTDPGFDYTENRMMLGMRLRR